LLERRDRLRARVRGYFAALPNASFELFLRCLVPFVVFVASLGRLVALLPPELVRALSGYPPLLVELVAPATRAFGMLLPEFVY
jgi:hypothetical protein